jgi:hypothetical protein
MLFILAIDPLHKLMELAATRGLLQPILPTAANLRCSLYANDAALFANPNKRELRHITQVLDFFGNCSGLRVNLNKTEIFPIRCDDTLINETLSDFPGRILKFPGKYLGLPLHIRKLRRVDVQPLLDKLGGPDLGMERQIAINDRPRDIGEKCFNLTTDIPSHSLCDTKMVDSTD